MAMTLPQIPQGSDLDITVTVRSGEDPVDLVTLSGLACWVVSERGTTLQKFSLNSITGFDALIVVNASEGKFSIRVLASKTKNALPGKYAIEVKNQVNNSGTFSSVSKKKVFMEITEAASKDTDTL